MDDTFSCRFQRERFRRLADEEASGFLILYVETPAKEIAARMAANRRNPVRADVLPQVAAFIEQEFQPPEADEPFMRLMCSEDVENRLERVG